MFLVHVTSFDFGKNLYNYIIWYIVISKCMFIVTESFHLISQNNLIIATTCISVVLIAVMVGRSCFSKKVRSCLCKHKQLMHAILMYIVAIFKKIYCYLNIFRILVKCNYQNFHCNIFFNISIK